ncbi:hypothetical protein [Desulfocastanea catecholica]
MRIEAALREVLCTGFIEQVWVQTLSKSLKEMREIEPLRFGYGQGAFVVVKVHRP